MTNRIALILAATIVIALILDALVNGSAATLFLLRKLSQLVQYLVFWR
ncbi:hypothetical protein [Rhodobacter sp. NSM]